MLELVMKSFTTVYVIRLVLNHNLFISKLIIEIKFLRIHIEINGKEKSNFLNISKPVSLNPIKSSFKFLAIYYIRLRKRFQYF